MRFGTGLSLARRSVLSRKEARWSESSLLRRD